MSFITMSTEFECFCSKSLLFWQGALMPNLAQGSRKYHTSLLHVWVHRSTLKTPVKDNLAKYLTIKSVCYIWLPVHYSLQTRVTIITLHLRVIHITFRLTVRPLPLCLAFLLFWRCFLRGGRLQEGTSLCSRRCLCRFLWQSCHPMTLWKQQRKTCSRQDRHLNPLH